jgi:hypothetical protein
MKSLLEQRAFLVDLHPVKTGSDSTADPLDLKPYAGLVIGSPVTGLGIKGAGPSNVLADFVRDRLPSLDEHKVALFCVYPVRPGLTFDRMKGMVLDKGADVVGAHAYSLLRPQHGEHVLPTECMVRIR